MGDDEDVAKLLKAVCFDKEVNDMEEFDKNLVEELFGKKETSLS